MFCHSKIKFISSRHRVISSIYNWNSETPTLSYTWSLIQAEPPHIGHYREYPPGYSNEPQNSCFAKCCGITCNFQHSRDDCAIQISIQKYSILQKYIIIIHDFLRLAISILSTRELTIRTPFQELVQKYGIVFPTVIVLYLNINVRIPYRVGYWIFWYKRILMLVCVL